MKLFERLVLWGTAAGLIVLGLIYFIAHTMRPELPTNWDYKDVVTILLAIVTVSLTVLGIIIAIAAFWSYQKITDLAAERAEAASATFLGSTAFITRVDLLISERMKNNEKDELESNLDVTSDANPAGPSADEPWVDQ